MIPQDTKGKLEHKIKTRWFAQYDFPSNQCPMVFLGTDGYYYMIAMFNRQEFPDYARRALDPNDPLLVAARDVLYIPPELEPTLMWYRFPMRWPLYVIV